jgi:DNA-binding PadR family transcriptional regulator
MLENLKPIEKIDFVLRYFIEMDNPPNRTDEEIKKDLNLETTKELFEILHRLEKDGYIVSEIMPRYGHNVRVYSSTFDGRTFQGRGGYQAKALRNEATYRLELIETSRRRSLDDHLEANTNRLNRLTLYLAIGTGALALIEITKFIVWIFSPQKSL